MKAIRYIYFLALCIAASAPLASCDDSEEEAAVDVKITLNENLMSLVLGTTGNLIATLDPSTANASGIRWESDDPAIASIATGVVTATGVGRTTVYARYGDNFDQCEVIVTDNYVATASVSLNKTQMTIAIGHEENLQATVLPEEATDKTVKWSSSAPAVVSVDEDGKITGLSVGDAVITVTTNDGDFTDRCEITVGPSVQLISPAADASIELYAGGRDVLKFTWSCDVATVTDYTFEIGTTPDFETPVYSLNLSSTELEISQYELNQLVKGADATSTIYWTVKPDPEGSALTSVRALRLDADNTEYLILHNPDGAISMSPLEGSNYGYHIVNTNWAAIHTAEMAAPVEAGLKVISLRFRSEQDVTLSIRFMRGATYPKGLDDITLERSPEWTEKRLLAGNLPDNWGQPGDSLRIILPVDSSYDFEVEALHFTDMTDQDGIAAYQPLWRVGSVFGVAQTNEEVYGRTEVFLEVIRREHETNPNYADPGVNFIPQTCIIPPKASILKFEYKCDVETTGRFNVFIYGEHLNPINASHGMSVTSGLPGPATEWTEFTIDFSAKRQELGWGDYYGTWNLRWDPTNVVGYQIHVRNFQLIEKQ